MSDSGNGKSLAMLILEILIALVVAVNTALTGWSLSHINALEIDVATIKANRFTASDGKEVWTEIARIRQDMTEQQRDQLLELARLRSDMQAIPAALPPKWFVDRVDKMEALLKAQLDENHRLLMEHLRKHP